ncbi:unnamed protein product [Laminaria digitata]
MPCGDAVVVPRSFVRHRPVHVLPPLRYRRGVGIEHAAWHHCLPFPPPNPSNPLFYLVTELRAAYSVVPGAACLSTVPPIPITCHPCTPRARGTTRVLAVALFTLLATPP